MTLNLKQKTGLAVFIISVLYLATMIDTSNLFNQKELVKCYAGSNYFILERQHCKTEYTFLE